MARQTGFEPVVFDSGVPVRLRDRVPVRSGYSVQVSNALTIAGSSLELSHGVSTHYIRGTKVRPDLFQRKQSCHECVCQM